MSTKQRSLYIHQKTGSVISATKAGAKNLPDDYKKVDIVTNDQGETVMRIRLENATVDISEREVQETATDVDNSPS